MGINAKIVGVVHHRALPFSMLAHTMLTINVSLCTLKHVMSTQTLLCMNAHGSKFCRHENLVTINGERTLIVVCVVTLLQRIPTRNETTHTMSILP